MRSMTKILLIAACAGTMVFAADAQPRDSNISLDAPGFLIKKPPPGAPDVRAQPLVWPRLDQGAVLCRSEADLIKLGQRRSGDAVDGPIDCQIIRAATGITIVQRNGPGRTEVTTTNSAAPETGWTDAWLPAKVPSGATSATR